VGDGRGAPRPGDAEGAGRLSRRTAAALLGLAALLAFAPLACGRPPAAADPDAPRGRVSRPPALPVWSGYSLREAERAAVEEFLRFNRDMRVATDADRRELESDDFRKLYGVYHPYFLRGDVNDDGVLDFVLAFVRRDSDRDSPWFSIVVFTGTDKSGFAAGSFLERDVSLADGDLSLDRDSIMITPDLEEEESTRRYRWDPIQRSHVFVRDDPEEDDEVPQSQT